MRAEVRPGAPLLRDVAFVSVGPTHPLFTSSFGGQATTLLTLTMLIVVTFGMSVLSNEQQTRALRAQATHDSLTGALNRAELFRLAHGELDAVRQMHDVVAARALGQERLVDVPPAEGPDRRHRPSVPTDGADHAPTNWT